MNIDYISDIHADTWVPFKMNQIKWEKSTRIFIHELLPTEPSDVLCLVGDTSNFNQQIIWIIEELAKIYNKIFYVFGNHEYYLVSNQMAKKFKNTSRNKINELKEKTTSLPVHYLEDFIPYEYEGVKFAGDIAWYPLETKEQLDFFYKHSNDSIGIKGIGIRNQYQKVIKSYEKLEEVDVICTHIPVILCPSHIEHKTTACYYTPINNFKAPIWISGHTHDNFSKTIKGTTFFLNCLGYQMKDNQAVPTKIKTIKINKTKKPCI